MVDFLLCILQYLLIMVVLAALAGVGAYIGIRLRKSKDAKNASITNTKEAE